MKQQTFVILTLSALLAASVATALLSCDADTGAQIGTDIATAPVTETVAVTETATEAAAPAENVISIPITPTAEAFEIPEAAFAAGGWEACTASFTLPDGWRAIPGDTLMPGGRIYDETDTERASYGIMWFDTLDDDPPENVPPEGQEWQAIYASMRLSSFQSMYDYEAVSRGDRSENALAMLEYITEFEPGKKPEAETAIVPIILGYDRDCSLYLQLTFTDDATDTEIRREIAQSIAFTKK